MKRFISTPEGLKIETEKKTEPLEVRLLKKQKELLDEEYEKIIKEL